MLLFCDSLPAVAWRPPDGFYQLGRQPVVYRLHVPDCLTAAIQATHLLEAAELRRAERYLHAADRQRFLVTRTTLRLLLSGYTRQAPQQLRFAAGRNQKPLLPGHPDLHFSVSHTQDWILIALGNAELGVDIEAQRPGMDFLDALHDNFRAAEAEYIWRSPDSRRLFYQGWTRKEAFAKATAGGIDELFASLPSLDGRYELPGPANVAWRISSFAVAAGYSAALAYQPAGSEEAPLFIDLTGQYLASRLLHLEAVSGC